METIQKTHPLVITAAASVTALSLAGIGALFGVLPTATGKPLAEPLPIAQAVVQPGVHPVVSPPAPLAKSEPAPTLSLPAGSSVRIETPSDKPRRAAAPAKPAPTREVVYVERPAPPPASNRQVRVAHDAPIYAERSERYDQPERSERHDRPARSDSGEIAIPSDYRRAEPPPACSDCGTIAGIREVTRDGEANGVGAVAGGVLGGVVGRQMGNGKGREVMTILGALGGAYAGHQVEKSQRGAREYEITVRIDDGTSQVVRQATAPGWRQGERVRVSGGQIVNL